MEAREHGHNIKGMDVDSVFAVNFTSDDCMDAIIAAQRQFDPRFPGWALYRRVIVGDSLLDRTLEAYAITMARAVSRALKSNGRRVVGAGTRSPAWVAQAGRDGLDFALFGKYPCGVKEREERFGVSWKPYQTVRNAVGGGLYIGINTFTSALHHEYFKIKRRKWIS
jgi:hypothetical protein